ncbi:hypothetical protein K1719_046876 [Acacia pycnantha]|nr:hypothetical protein K1719_046876 [Acacia pycnantha]
MARLEKIGFDKLVHICCAQIPRHLCGQFMDGFDPPTKNVVIRGKSLHLRPEDVKQLMGLPCNGGEIERKAKKDDKAFKSLKRSYGSVPYKMIGNLIIESKVEEQVIVATKEDFREYDWCTFVLNELCTSIGEYKKKVRKGKGTLIGHCILHCNLLCASKRRVKIERESKKGLLLPYGDEVGQSSTELHPESALTHSGARRTTCPSSKTLQGAESDECDVNDEVQSEEEEPCTQNEEDGEEDGGDIEKEDEDEDEGSKATRRR